MCGGTRKRMDRVSPGRPQSFRYQRRPVEDCSPGREGMRCKTAKQGAERFMLKGIAVVVEKVRAGLRHEVVMPKCDGGDPGEDRPKQACSCWFARHR